MAKLYKTLHKKDDETTEIYPNIESDNIPSGAITSDKLHADLKQDIDDFDAIYDHEDNKINVSTVITDELYTDRLHINRDLSVGDTSVNGDLDVSGSITFTETPSVENNNNYYLYVNDWNFIHCNLITKCDLSNYTDSQINHALDFDNKSSISDFTSLDIEILIEIFTNVTPIKYGSNSGRIDYQFFTNNRQIDFTVTDTLITIELDDTEHSTIVGRIEIDLSTSTIVDFVSGLFYSLIPIKLLN